MKKYIIGTVIVLAALVVGVGAALFATRTGIFYNRMGSSGWFNTAQSYNRDYDTYYTNPGMMGNSMRTGMMGRNIPTWQNQSASRISLDSALQAVQAYTAQSGDNFEVAEIMEFSSNFYAVILEKDSGKAAFEVLVDPYSGDVFPEYGPNMMWNIKYGHMGNGSSPKNTVTFEEARTIAQQSLDAQVPGAQVEPDGFSFYGYYTFDYAIDGQIAGMLSVNGFDGQAWLHTWHGQFITEEEVSE